MVEGIVNRASGIPTPFQLLKGEAAKSDISEAQIDCVKKGGRWDKATQTCVLPQAKTPIVDTAPKPLSQEEVIAISKQNEGKAVDQFGNVTEITRETQEEGKDEIERIQSQETGVGAKAALAQQQAQQEGQLLAGQVGQIEPSTGIEATDLSEKEALIVGIRNSIPRALGLAVAAGSAAAVGGAAATAPLGGVGAIPAAAIGAAAGFTTGIASGLIGSMKSQRTDNTNAQQRVLDEGKQTLKDWSTMAKTDPSNRELYLTQFNRQLQIIQDAHVQMLTDTKADVAKYESAIPNLAEFNSFYSVGGERDALIRDMQISLQTPSSSDYEMLTLSERYK